MLDIGLEKDNINSFSFSFADNINEIDKLVQIIDAIKLEWNIDDKVSFSLNLVLEELITNTIFYGFKAKKPENIININIERKEDQLIINVSDNALEFNILDREEGTSKLKALDKQKVGGLGIHLVKKMASSIVYKRENGFNYLTLSINII